MIPPFFHAEVAPPQTTGNPDSRGSEAHNQFDALLASILAVCNQDRTVTECSSSKRDHAALSLNHSGIQTTTQDGLALPVTGRLSGDSPRNSGNHDSVGSTQAPPNPSVQPIQAPISLAPPRDVSFDASLGKSSDPDSVGNTQGPPNPSAQPIQTPIPLVSPRDASSVVSLSNSGDHDSADSTQRSPDPSPQPVQIAIPFAPSRDTSAAASPSLSSNQDSVGDTQGSPNEAPQPFQTPSAPPPSRDMSFDASVGNLSNHDSVGSTQGSPDPSPQAIQASIALAPSRDVSFDASPSALSNHISVGNTQGARNESAQPFQSPTASLGSLSNQGSLDNTLGSTNASPQPVQAPIALAPSRDGAPTVSPRALSNQESVGNTQGSPNASPQPVPTPTALAPPRNASLAASRTNLSNQDSVDNAIGSPNASSQPVPATTTLSPPRNASFAASQTNLSNQDSVGNTQGSPNASPRPIQTPTPLAPPRNASDVPLAQDRLAADRAIELHPSFEVAAIDRSSSNASRLPVTAVSNERAVSDIEFIAQETSTSPAKNVSVQDTAHPFSSGSIPADASSPVAMHRADSSAAVVRQVSDTIVSRAQLTSNDQHARLEIQLDPPELGRVVIHLEQFGDDRMNARLVVSEDAARVVLERELVTLRHTLEENGIALNHLNVACQGERSDPQTTWQRDESRFAWRRVRRNEPSQDDASNQGSGTIDVKV